MQGHFIYVRRLSHFALWGISGCAWGQKNSFPFNGRWWFAGDIITNSIDTDDLIHDSGGDCIK